MRYQRLLSVLLTGFSLTVGGCGGHLAKQMGETSPPHLGSDLAGSYYMGDHLGYNLELNLSPDQLYSASLSGCLGIYALEEGRWRILDDTLLVLETPAGRDRPLPELACLIVQCFDKCWILVPADSLNYRYYSEQGVCDWTCLQSLACNPQWWWQRGEPPPDDQ